MGASVIAWWPGITDEQIEGQPGFFNDCKAWGDWMAEREGRSDVLAALDALRVTALRTYITDGVDPSDVAWVAPKELSSAALRLRELVLARRPETRCILDSYAKSANDVDPIEDEFAQDLSDVAEIADWARREGAERMTLEVDW